MYVKVRVSVDVKKEICEMVSSDTFRVSVRQKAKQNMANRRVVEILADHFSVPQGKIRLISGHHSPHKIFSVDVD